MNSFPLFSVITPSFNRADLIRHAVESVLAQKYEPFEHIIMDGGSTDGTLELLASYPHLNVVSGPDKGLYDALNKGVSMARGEIVAQLNTDDVFEPGIFPAVARLFTQHPEADAVSGGADFFERLPEGEHTIKEFDSIREDELPYRTTMGVPVFNAWFFRKTIFERVGPYSLDYPLVADRDFLMRFYLTKLKVLQIDAVVYHYLQHSGSLTINSQGNLPSSLLMEILHLSEKYLRSQEADPVLKKYCAEWHDLTAIELISNTVRQRKLFAAVKIAWLASKANPSWLFLVIAQSPKRIRNYIRKKHAAIN
jgi:glycosyltransferase involved in cell wall biosynthesis